MSVFHPVRTLCTAGRRTAFIMVSVAVFIAVSAGFVRADPPPGLTFLRLELDARGAALGGAMVARGTGLSALHWNPAGLSIGGTHEVGLSHRRGFEDIDSEYFGLLLKKGTDRAVAFSVFSNNIGGIEHRMSPTSSPSGIISANDFFAGVSYSQSVTGQLQAGVTVKYLYQKLFFDSSSGFAGDIGIRYTPQEGSLTLGFAVQNIGSMSAFRSEKPTMPSLLRAGAAYVVPSLKQTGHSVSVSADYERLFEGDGYAHAGIEYQFENRYSLRGGYITGFDERGLSLGAGIAVRRLGLDYSFLPDVTSFGNQHLFSLRMRI